MFASGARAEHRRRPLSFAMLQLSHDLENHLVEVLVRLLEDKPDDPLAAFEALSRIVSAETHGAVSAAERSVPATVVNEYTLPSVALLQTKFNKTFPAYDAEKCSQLLGLLFPTGPAPEEGADEGAEEGPTYTPANTDFEVQDLVRDAEAIRRFGIDVGTPDTVFQLALSIQRLCEAKPLRSARLFACIQAMHNPYYIVECVFQDDQRPREAAAGTAADAGADGDPDAEGESAKKAPEEAWERFARENAPPPAEIDQGANTYCYFVATSATALADDWTLLPDVTPAMILASRKVRRLFSGDLDAPLESHPPFPEGQAKEKFLLRAQIARISAGSLAAPVGLLTVPDQEEEEEDAGRDEGQGEEGGASKTVGPPLKELLPVETTAEYSIEGSKLALLQSWVHMEPHLSQHQGRCTLFMQEGSGGGEEEEEDGDGDEGSGKKKREKTPAELEACPKQLRALSFDDALDWAVGHVAFPVQAWSVRSVFYSHSSEPVLMGRSYAVRCNRWPGAISIAYPLGLGPEPEGADDDDGKKKKAKPERPVRFRVVNIYVGDGVKVGAAGGLSYAPPREFAFQTEAASAEAVICHDPTAEELSAPEFQEPAAPEEGAASGDADADASGDGAEE